ncbi:MAG: fructose-6-phosphate aldolase [Deltaproteobacteria bacterium]|jgi:transaldolase|nr:fructose-6-phosphate aldolase [Deltaproteobacteria bacterium]MBW2651895.1 fructose-6-phosphate aldolase [Deltaproteobacteria bacterium]
MKLFIDTANIDEIKEATKLGLIDGITTNPTLIAREGKEFMQIVKEICEIVDGPISLEAVSTKSKDMVKEARGLAKIHSNVVVKIPMTREGLIATRQLAMEGIHVNMTLVFSPTQALLAAKTGAAYVSPFIGRLDDISHWGMDLVEQILTIYDNYDFDTEIIVASIRNPLHVLEAALIGADIATVPFKVIEQLIKHPLTDIGVERFLKDWEKVENK